MKIAVITDDGLTISQHLGRAKHYMVVSIENDAITSHELRSKIGHTHFVQLDDPGSNPAKTIHMSRDTGRIPPRMTSTPKWRRPSPTARSCLPGDGSGRLSQHAADWRAPNRHGYRGHRRGCAVIS